MREFLPTYSQLGFERGGIAAERRPRLTRSAGCCSCRQRSASERAQSKGRVGIGAVDSHGAGWAGGRGVGEVDTTKNTIPGAEGPLENFFQRQRTQPTRTNVIANSNENRAPTRHGAPQDRRRVNAVKRSGPLRLSPQRDEMCVFIESTCFCFFSTLSLFLYRPNLHTIRQFMVEASHCQHSGLLLYVALIEGRNAPQP